jgi:tRNA threonylcarbamoyladenosine biosynthesis protein TsaE
MIYISGRPDDTIEFERKLAEDLKGSEVIILSGDMGAGKTTFTKGLALGLNITDTIVSPTFTLMNSYLGRLSLYHYDMFRIENKEEIAELGIEEYLGQSDGVSVVEWNKFDL